MKKLVKKIVVAVLAMAMAIGMLAVSVSAADTVKVTVKWADAEGADTSLYGWDGVDGFAWPGKQMTKVDDTTYTFELTPAGDTCMLIPNNSKGQTVDLGPVDLTKGEVLITIGEKGSDGKYTAEVTYPAPAPAGDATPYIAVAAVAVLALGAVVVLASKKKVVTE